MEDVWSGDIWTILEAHPSTKDYCLDRSFRATIKAIRANPTSVGKYSDDPRIVQASALLVGQTVAVTEADILEAERAGRIPRRSPILAVHREIAANYSIPGAAKDAGNQHFRAGENGLALACYERCVELVPEKSSELKAMAYSNIGAVFLKLQYYREAEKACSRALKAAPPEMSLSKALYRRALAREHLGISFLPKAISDMKKSLHRVLSEGQVAEEKKLRADLLRMEKALVRCEELQKEGGQRQSTMALLTKPPAEDGFGGYIKEMDYSHTTKKQLRGALAGVYTHQRGCRVALKEMVEKETKIAVSVMSKDYERRLFYDFDILCAWEGTSKKGRETEGTFGGFIRLFNIAQDTKFEIGGLPETSWMFSLGFRCQHNCPWSIQAVIHQNSPFATPPPKPDPASEEEWVRDIKATADDLFEPIAIRVKQVIKVMEEY